MTDDDRRWPSARQAIDDVEADAPRSPIDAVRRRFRRLSGSYLLVVQICLASVAAWVVATEVIGHVQPFFAPVAAVVTVTAGLGQRHRVVVELVIGVAVGILVGELLIGLIGRGTWQLALVVALAALSAALLDVGRLAVVQASTSAILIVTVLPSAGSTGSPAVNRFVDALVGGLFGLLATALVPANPVRRLNREVGSVLGELAALLEAAARALRWTDPGVAWTALQQARALQDPLEGLGETTSTARELSRLSPMRWRQRDHVLLYARTLKHVDLAIRDARVLTRRVHTMLRRGDRSGLVLAPVLESLAAAVRVFADDLSEQDRFDEVRQALLDTAREATGILGTTRSLGVTVVVAQIRSLAADLLYATGVTAQELDELLGLGADRAPTTIPTTATEARAASAQPRSSWANATAVTSVASSPVSARSGRCGCSRAPSRLPDQPAGTHRQARPTSRALPAGRRSRSAPAPCTPPARSPTSSAWPAGRAAPPRAGCAASSPPARGPAASRRRSRSPRRSGWSRRRVRRARAGRP